VLRFQSEEITEAFDYVLIDCPPRLTTACVNALAASDFVLIPAQPEVNSIRSVPHLMTRLKGLREIGVLTHLRVLGIVASMAASSPQEKVSYESKLLRQSSDAAGNIWGAPVGAFKSKLTDSASYASASRMLQSNEPLKLAVTTSAIRDQYLPLLKEIEAKINEVIGTPRVPS
jgi:chromosome partitioning protein